MTPFQVVPTGATLLAAAAMLTACSGAPSESDIKQAMERAFAQAAKNPLLPGAGQIRVISVKKLGCEAAGNGYSCDVEVESKAPIVGTQKQATKLRLIKGSDGWVMTQ